VDVGGNQESVVWKFPDARAGSVVHVVVVQFEAALENPVPEFDAPRREQVVQSWNVGAPRVWHPPLPSVLVVKFHFLHDGHVVPVCKNYNREASIDVSFQLCYLFGVVLFFGIDDEQGSVLGSVEARERRS
jgi:hypothetical protein